VNSEAFSSEGGRFTLVFDVPQGISICFGTFSISYECLTFKNFIFRITSDFLLNVTTAEHPYRRNKTGKEITLSCYSHCQMSPPRSGPDFLLL
jgi:hypothetical protein